MAEYATYIYRIIDKFSPVLRKMEKANKRFEEGIKKASSGMGRIGIKADKVKNAMMAFGTAAGAALIVAAKKSMDFESVMTDVNKVVKFSSDKQFADFRESILKTSVELGKLPKNLAQIAVAGGKLGVPVQDMENFIRVVARTSVAFDMLESTAGEQIGSIQAKLGLTVDETGNLMDAVNFLADNTSAGGARMIEIIARTSGTLKSIDMPRKFMAGWAAFADQMEVTPELAASGLNMMIARMRKMPGMLEKMIASPQEAIAGLLKELAGLDAVQRNKQVDKLFGPEAGRFVLKAVTNMQKFDDTMKLVNDDTKFCGSMMNELTKKLSTSETAWGKIKAIFDVVAITIGDVLTPYIKEAAPKIVNLGFAFRDWSKTHPQMLKLAVAIAAISAALVPIMLIGAILGAPLTAIGLAIVGVSAAIFEIQQNWKYLVMDFKLSTEWMTKALKDLGKWWVEAFTFDFIVEGIDYVVEKIKPMIDWFYKLDKVLGFETEKPKAPITEKELADKIARVRAMRREMGIGSKGAAAKETGVAAANVAATKASLNGSIVVSAKQGSAIESAGMKTSVPGNLGFNLMGATP